MSLFVYSSFDYECSSKSSHFQGSNQSSLKIDENYQEIRETLNSPRY